MKDNGRIRERVTKADNLKMPGCVLRRCECWCNDEAETVIVAMIPDQDTPIGALLAYRLETSLDELAAHTAPLKCRFDRHGTEGKPSALLLGTPFREGDMANDLLTQHGDERQSECIGLTQRIDDERFSSVAERDASEGARRERPDRVPVNCRLTPNYNAKTALIAQISIQGLTPASSGRRRAGPLKGEAGWPVEDAMLEPLEIAMRARQGVVKELCRLADIHTYCLGFFPVHETNCHRYQIGRPPRKEAPRPLREVIDETTAGHVAMVIEGQMTIGHEHMIARETAPGPDPNGTKGGKGEPFEERVGEDVTGSSRKENPIGKIPTPYRVLLDAWS